MTGNRERLGWVEMELEAIGQALLWSEDKSSGMARVVADGCAARLSAVLDVVHTIKGEEVG